MNRAAWAFVLAVVVSVALTAMGCAGIAELLAYTGGGLPPGEPDLGGVVVAEAPDVAAASVDTAQTPPPVGTGPVVGADVLLMRGSNIVGRTSTGPGGYFRFENPGTGNYRVVVTPPAGSGLQGTERAVMHQFGQMSYLTIVLEREPGAGPGPGG